ncbi:MAG: enoyl-CoA hydratase/isomerase family protein [Bacteroidia bacterium]|nr:enoyl-CoA hydratase/isomerase family protein [Bacteroidia bacterium]MCZ2276638.1 enoyl-CoA hydratase/isomerase family protein [Bacteroidia bacterium]
MKYILSDIQGPVAIIKLNRTEKYNSFIREMSVELQQAIDEAVKHEPVRSLLITGEGKAFCSGQDLSEAIDPGGPGIKKIVEEHYNPVILKIRNAPKPVIAAVNGVAAGAGANIALACDIVLAGKSATFIQAFSKIGLIPDSGGTFILPRLVGWHRALALCMTGDKVSADEAKAMGMVYKVYDDEKLLEEAISFAKQMASMPTTGLAYTKMLFNRSATQALEQQLNDEGEFQVKATATFDFKEGVNAFMEKRKPQFTGK